MRKNERNPPAESSLCHDNRIADNCGVVIADPDHISPPSAIANLGVLEVDAFCIGCHYNLHGQVVTLDDRLGIPICRCPECGRFHPAGTGVTASSLWIRRFSTLLLFVWVGVVLLVISAGLIAMAGVTAASINAFTTSRLVSADGKPVVGKMVNGTYAWVEEGTDIVVANVHNVSTLRPFLSTNNSDGLNELSLTLSFFSLLLGFAGGTLCVTLLWHWPFGRYFWCLLFPLGPAIFLMLVYGDARNFEFLVGQLICRIAGQTTLQCGGALLGVIVGRKVSRTLIRMLVPPKPRQFMAFLWMIDGKPLPVGMTIKAK